MANARSGSRPSMGILDVVDSSVVEKFKARLVVVGISVVGLNSSKLSRSIPSSGSKGSGEKIIAVDSVGLLVVKKSVIVKLSVAFCVDCVETCSKGVNVLFKRKIGGRVVSIKAISEDVDDVVDPAELIKVGSGVFCVKL